MLTSFVAMDILSNQFVLLALTFGVYFVACRCRQRMGQTWLNPILLTIIVLIVVLKAMDVPFETYQRSGSLIEFWLKPAVVALGVPLYLQLKSIRRQLWPIIASQLAGCVAGIISVVLIADLLGASREVILSLASKSVTTPIAIEITSTVGGIPSLTAAVVVSVGIFGAMFGFQVLNLGHVGSPIAQGLSLGTASHAVGTSAALERGQRYGAFASLGLTINGILTAILTPTILELMGYLE